MSVYHLSIAPSGFSAFEELVQRIVMATREEDDTTIYEYVVNAEHTVVHIIERYEAGRFWRGVFDAICGLFSLTAGVVIIPAPLRTSDLQMISGH